MALPAWCVGGNWVPGVVVAFVLCVGSAWALHRPPAAGRRTVSRIVLLCAILHLGVLLTQCANSGRPRVYDSDARQWTLQAPPRPHFPHAVERAEAVDQLRWFVPFWVIAVLIPGSTTRREALRLARWLLYCTAAMGLVGILHHVCGWTRLLGIIEVPRPRGAYALFTYANNAAAYFLLFLPLALHRALRIKHAHGLWKRQIPAGISALLVFAGTVLSYSRAAVLLALAVAGILLIGQVARPWSTSSKGGKVERMALASIVMLVVLLLVAGFDGGSMWRETSKRLSRDGLARDLSTRMLPWTVAVEILRENPVWGVGAWGFRHHIPLVVPPERWPGYVVGLANVHCDPLQFMVEFGLAGAFPLALAAALLAALAIQAARRSRDGRASAMLAGIGLVALQSLFDLPFRTPAVLWPWMLLLCLTPSLGQDGAGPTIDLTGDGSHSAASYPMGTTTHE